MSQPSSDRNLLFGILALQMDFVARDDLIAAMNLWALDKAKGLGEVLRDMGRLPADEHALLEALVAKHLHKHHDDPGRSLATLGLAAPLAQDLRQVADPDVQASLAHVSAAPDGHDPEATAPYLGPGTLPPHARFRILRPHARGGLGEVFVARDEELKREVALKEIQQRHANHPDNRARFLLEAEVTGALEHPGIVPVYGLGAYADGRPFYAMRFVHGDSLKDAIRAFHDADARGRGDSERSLALRRLLGRFVDVCNAVAYAHSRGVLHRDLKPANVMLGKYGETLVVDWGLAKVLGRADAEATEGMVASSGDSALTQAGRALGTPAYMSPEQAAGRLDELGPRSDVYSLGATLYCLLTGRAPFAETDAGEVLRKVRRGDFPPPRQVNPQVPAALEGVCLKAMALRPEGRYATPRELAEEVERWLADEPVRAYREPRTARVGRWLRRHQTLTVGAGVLLLTGVLALAVSTLLIGDALRKEEQARQERALAQVDALLHADPQAVPALLTNLEPNREDVLPRLRELWAEEDRPEARTRRGRVGLALLPVEPDLVKGWLFEWMLTADDAREVLLVRDALQPYRAELPQDLWRRVEGPATPPSRRFRALVALAAFDPDGRRWDPWGEELLEQLLTADLRHRGAWSKALRPVRRVLLEPLVSALRKQKTAEQRTWVALFLLEYAADRPAWLAGVALDMGALEYHLVSIPFLLHREKVEPVLLRELVKVAPEKATDAEKDALASRQASAAVMLLDLGQATRVWPFLRHTTDPSRRTYLTHRLAAYGVKATVLLDRLQVEKDVSVRRALVLSLGEYAPDKVPAARRKEFVARLVRDYADDPDPGVHGAIEWLLRQWKEDGRLPKLRNHKPDDPPKGEPT